MPPPEYLSQFSKLARAFPLDYLKGSAPATASSDAESSNQDKGPDKSEPGEGAADPDEG